MHNGTGPPPPEKITRAKRLPSCHRPSLSLQKPPSTPPCVTFLCTLPGRREVAGDPQWVFPYEAQELAAVPF